METINMLGLAKVLETFGLLGLVILLWWLDMKKVYKVLDQYKHDMDEIRTMYERNVSLTKDYHSVASDLREVVILNTQAMTRISDEIRQNEFCPMQRVEKKKVYRAEGG